MSDLKKICIATVLSVIAMLIVCLFVCGCGTPPELLKNKDGVVIESMACYNARVCSYYNKNNAGACEDQWKECRARSRYEDCGKEEYRWKNYDCQSCWDKLNSK